MTVKHSKRNPGITLLLVMLILSIVATIALGVAFLILRQFQQGGDVKSSVQAQVAADSGIEEVLYRAKVARLASSSSNDFLAHATTGLLSLFDCGSANPLIPKKIGSTAGFCLDKSQTLNVENVATGSIKRDQTFTVDLFDDPSKNFSIKAFKINGVADAGTWLEVTWVAWDTSGGTLAFKSSSTKAFFSGSDLTSGKIIKLVNNNGNAIGTKTLYLLNSPNGMGNCVYSEVVGDLQKMIDDHECICRDSASPASDPVNCSHPDFPTNFNYIVRIKALYGDAQSVQVTACKDTVCDPTQVQPIPSRVTVKVVGEAANVKQAMQVSIPWTLSLAGLYDYAILSETNLSKDTQVNPGFFSTGAIEAEREVTSFNPSTAPFECNKTGLICTGWDVTASTNASCVLEPSLGASNGADCRFNNQTDGSITYGLGNVGLPDLAASYYLNYRVRVSSEYLDEQMSIQVNGGASSGFDEKCTGNFCFNAAPNKFKDKDGWLTCTATKAGFLKTSTVTFSVGKQCSGGIRDGMECMTGIDCPDGGICNVASQHSPRLDWFAISSIAAAPLGACVFQAWGASGDKTYQIEDFLPTLPPPLECSGISQPSAPGQCDVAGNWRGANRVGSQGTGGPYTPTIICNSVAYPLQCYVRDDSLGNAPTGFTMPFQSTLGVDDRIAEGNYYVTLKYGRWNLSASGGIDQFGLDVGAFPARGAQLLSLYSMWVLNSPSLIYRLGVLGTNKVTIDANTSFVNPAAGTTHECVLPNKMRIKPGDSFLLGVYNKSSGANPFFNIDHVRISADLPTGIQTCILP